MLQAGISRTARRLGVRSALLADQQLSERPKQVRMEIYESCRREEHGRGGRNGYGIGRTGE